jgi:uncharacterized protein YgiM (DUF1202 family)
LTAAVGKGYTTPTMRLLITLCALIAIVGLPTAFASPFSQTALDPRDLALTAADLPAGYSVVKDRTRLEERPDGAAIFETAFARQSTAENLAAGPIEIRSGAARTTGSEEASKQFDASRSAFKADGWTEAGVPPLGDRAIGASRTGEGGQAVEHIYLFRQGQWIMLVSVLGKPEVTKLSDTVGLAIVVADRLSTATGRVAPAPSSPQPASQQSAAKPSGERVRITNPDGGNVNVRAEPSLSAQILQKLQDGAELSIVGSDRDADGYTWRNVRLEDGRTGWVAGSFLTTIATPAPTVTPTATPRASSEPGSSERATPTPRPQATATPQASSPGSSSSSSDSSTKTAKGPGGVEVQITPRSAELSSGQDQGVNVRVTKNGGGVGNARVDVTARLSATQYMSVNAPRTDGNGVSDVSWKMEGPSGTYELLVDVRLQDGDEPIQAKTSFRLK